MLISLIKNKLLRASLVLLVLLFSVKAQSQTCFTAPQTGCCNNINFNFSPTISYSGNLVTVSQIGNVNTISFISNSVIPCTDNVNIKVTYDYGDGTTFGTPVPKPYNFSHTYTLSNACVTNTFLVRACIQNTLAQQEFACTKTYTLSIPPISKSISILNQSCNTYTFGYTTSAGVVNNAQWNFGNGILSPVITSGATSIAYTYPTAGNYTVQLTGSGIATCPATLQVAPITSGAPNFSVIANNPCVPSAGVVLSISNYSAANTYQWLINGLPVVATGAIGTYTSNLTTATNTITMLVTTGSGCNASITKTVNIGNASITGITATQTGCKSFSFTYNAVSGASISSAQWSFGNGNLSPLISTGSNSIAYTYPVGGTYVVGITVNSISACPIYTQVTAVDIADADFTYTLANVCTPTAGIILSIVNHTPTLNYQWKINNFIVPATGAVGTYTNNLTVVSNTIQLSVSNGSCANYASKLINIGTATSNIGATSNSVCVGTFLSFYGVNSGADVYQWNIKKPDGTNEPPLIGMNPYYMFNNQGTYSVSLFTQNNYTVGGAVTSCTAQTPVNTVTVFGIPNPTFVLVNLACNGAVSVSIPTNTFTSYSLNYGNGTLFTGASSIPTIQTTNTYTTNGVYTVSLSLNNNGCSASYTNNINIAAGLASLSIVPTNSLLCFGATTGISAVLNNVPSNAGTPSYTWTGPSSFTSNQANISTGVAGVYTLNVSSNGACPLNLTRTTTITALASTNVTLVSVAPIPCTTNTTSAIIQISAALQQQGYKINGVLTPANPLATAPITVAVTNLGVGPNYITVSNALSEACFSNVYANGVQNNPVLAVTPSNPTSCSTGAVGSAAAVVTPAGGTISWYTVANFPTTAITTGASINNLLTGSYVAKVVNGYCSATNYFSITPPVINLTKTGPAGTCSGSLASQTITAAFVPSTITSAFTYNWFRTAPTYSAFGSGSSNIKNLGAGTYSITVTAANSCSANINFNIIQYAPITASFETTLPTCNVAGNVQANVSGGDGNYTYQWKLNSVINTTAITNNLSLAGITAPTTISLTVNDGSGCSLIAPSPGISIVPNSIVTLTNNCYSGGIGPANSVKLTNCDIAACVKGGVAPYTFEWYKLVKKTSTIQWSFYYDAPGGNFIANNGSQTYTVNLATAPTNSTMLASQILALNYNDSLKTTVVYPSWNFTTSPVTPLLNPIGSASLGVLGTSTNAAYYYPVVETVTVSNAEEFVAAYSGTAGTTYSNVDFTDGDYKLYVTDANGCKYPFIIGPLNFPKPNTFPVDFDYAWGLNKIDTPEPDVSAPLQDAMIEAANEIAEDVSACLQKKTKTMNSLLAQACASLDQIKDNFSVQFELIEHHYTLYYYDRAGQLTKTVPPEGVKFLTAAQITSLKALRSATIAPAAGAFTGLTPQHSITTTYQYNSFGQLLTQNTPDGGTSNFIYDSKNRLRFSQNAKQVAATPPVYSYNKYDELGRISEVGESSLLTGLSFATPTLAANVTVANNTVFPATNNKQITTTVYSNVAPVSYYGIPQHFTQNRVSYITIDPDPATTGDEHSTYFSYDSHGNVEWLLQDDPTGLGKNYIAYEYDLISGKVLKVKYNERRSDRFYHKYLYDAENRLTNTFTSRDGEQWDEDASYNYYAHGPLKRQVIGEDHVQGLDYIYTIHGWLKSLNSPSLTPLSDPGSDNSTTLPPPNNNPQEKVAADRHGMVLNYYTGDYKSNSSNFLTASSTNTLYSLASYSSSAAPSLYNGNISSWVQSQLNTVSTAPMVPRADLYQYDLLNRIKQSTSLEANTAGTTWAAVTGTSSGTAADAFKTTYTYDGNGNILALKRYNQHGVQMDDLQYTYDNGPMGEALAKNRLTKVVDNETGNVLIGRGDLEGQHNFAYDNIGNLIQEVAPERLTISGSTNTFVVTTNIDWTVYGKLKEVRKSIAGPSSTTYLEKIKFAYDASGNRIKKEYWKDNMTTPNSTVDPQELTTTYYVRDAQGNIMGTYKKYFDISDSKYKYDLIEQPIYGSDRLGQNNRKITLSSATSLGALATPTNGINILSEYQNWITSADKAQLLPGTSGGNNLCQCKIVSISNTLAPNYTGTATAVDFLGIANNGVAVAENLSGALQFYVVLAKKYLGNADACLIYDKNGKLMKGTETIAAIDVNSKPIVVNIPGTAKYNVITLNAAKQPIYHVVDMNAQGYSPIVGTNAGEVIAVNQNLITGSTPTNVTQGFHFTGLENHIAGQAVVYSSRYTPNLVSPTQGTTDIIAYDFGTSTVTPQANLLYSIPGCGNTETGELQLSPNGNNLAWYQHDKSVSGFKMRTGYIYTLPLDLNKTAISGTVQVHPISSAGNVGNGALEFMTNNNDLLYSQRGVYKQGGGTTKYDKNVWKYDPIALSDIAINPDNLTSPTNISYLFGEIKRGVDGKFYIPNMGTPANKIHSYTGSTWAGTVNIAAASYSHASSLPTQVWKIYAEPTQTLSEYPRFIGDKQYELKDHLANVKTVISDEKLITDAGTPNVIDNNDNFTPNVLSYQDFFAGGQMMPGRTYNSNLYRYGFNGKENDNEVKGTGNSLDFGARIYDPRLGRWLSVDPEAKMYPNISPYTFGLDNPIFFIDPDGGKIVDSQGKEVVVTFGKGNAPIYKYTDGSSVTDAKFLKDAKPILDAMSKTKVGQTIVKAMGDVHHDVSFKIDRSGPKFYNEKTGQYSDTEKPGFEPIYGQTESKVDSKGELISTEITIFEGTIDNVKKTPSNQIYQITIENKTVDQSDFSKEEIMGATGTHEGTHATDKDSNRKLGAKDPEALPDKNELEHYKESDKTGTKVKDKKP